MAGHDAVSDALSDAVSDSGGAAGLVLSLAAVRAAGIGPLRHVPVTGSSNADLASEARRGMVGDCVLVSDHQTAGRGRLQRRWNDIAGRSLLVSFRFGIGSPLDTAAHDKIAAITAAARAAAAAVVEVPVLSKWPNDLVIMTGPARGKLAGVLAELIEGPRPVVIVGLGMNILPMQDLPGATSLAEAGAGIERDQLLASLVTGLVNRLQNPALAKRELRDASATIGRRVRVERGDRPPLVGLAHDIDASGRLIVSSGAAGAPHMHRIAVGDVIHLRPDEPSEP